MIRIIRFALLGALFACILACGGATLGQPSPGPGGASPSIDEIDEEPTDEEPTDEETDEPGAGGDLESFGATYLEIVDNLNYATAESLAELDDPEIDEETRYAELISLSSSYDLAAEELGIYAFPDEVQDDVDNLRGELITLAIRFDSAANDASVDVESILASRSVLSEIGGRLRETAGLPPPSPNSP